MIRVHGGKRFESRNKTKKRVLDALVYQLAFLDTFLDREKYYKTYTIGGNKSYLNYNMWRKRSLEQCMRKVILGESVITRGYVDSV